MLNKVLKHDFKTLGKRLLPLYLLTIALSVFAKVVALLGEKIELIEILSGFAMAFCVLAIVSLMFVTFVICIRRFYTHLFKAEGYLTNSLPVTRNTLVLSKVVSSVVFYLLSIVTIILSVSILWWDLELFEMIFIIIREGFDFVLPVIVLLIVVYLSYYLMILAAYSLGQTRKGNKISNAVIAGILIYFVNQIIFLILMGIFTLVKPNFIELFENPSTGAIKTILWMSVGMSAMVLVVYYLIIIGSLNKKMDIE